MMEKNLEYYLNLTCRIEVRPISDEEGGGFIAWWNINGVHQKLYHCHGKMAQLLVHAPLSVPI